MARRWHGELLADLRKCYGNPDRSAEWLAKRFGISAKSIRNIARREGWPLRADRLAHLARLNSDQAMRAKINAACSEGMKRYWKSRPRLPEMTPQQRWKYRVIREVHGREEALRQVMR